MKRQTESWELVQLAYSIAQKFLWLSASQFMEVVDVWKLEKIPLHWVDAPGLRQAKQLITALAVKVEIRLCC